MVHIVYNISYQHSHAKKKADGICGELWKEGYCDDQSKENAI